MRVVFNRSAALGVRTGVGHYTAELFRGLCALAGDLPDAIHIDGYPRSGLWWARNLWAQCFPDLRRGRQAAGNAAGSATGSEVGAAAPSLPQRILGHVRSWGRALHQRHSRAFFHSQSYDLYHEPNCIPLASNLATVTTLHDLSALLHPEWHPAERVRWYDTRFRESLAQSQHFITGSEAVRQEVIDLLGIAPAMVTSIHYGVREAFTPLPAAIVDAIRRRLGLPERYLLHVGTIEPRKNVLRLMQAYCSLPAAVRQRCPLVLIGCWGWNAASSADYFHREARQRGVIHLGYLAERHLPVAYNGALALCFPSFYEGLGLPPLEMMACGGAVIASTAAAVREAVGDCAHLVDPEDQDGWRDAMLQAATDPEWRQRLRAGAEDHACAFTWERNAAQTLDVYRRLVDQSSVRQPAVFAAATRDAA
ncbi:MAG: glycosyltransferase family 4 protein [Gemmataceae bacterium]|nr:glycosyltransferase family 4 protein [Gemmataceae bacterium]